MITRRSSAFTLVEILVAACLSSVVGLVVFGVASEGLTFFARNVSINRSYSNARQAIDRISIAMQSAGHTPVLVSAAGADMVAGSTVAAGIRFWRYSSTPLYYINNPALTDTSLTLSLYNPYPPSPNPPYPILPAPAVGDMITVGALGFQARVVSVTTTATTAVVTFSGTVASNTLPTTLTASALASATNAAAGTTATPTSNNGKMTCLDWRSVAFIAVNNQLRYFPTFISGTTNVNTPANYQVLTYLTALVQGNAPPLPFSLGPTPSVNVDLYAEAPDYNNRTAVAGTLNGSTGLNTANTYSYLQTALSPRNAAIMQGSY